MPEPTPDPPAPAADSRQWAAVRSLLELFVVTGFAITQPLLDVTGRAPEFFLFADADRMDIIAFVLIVVLAPTLVLWLIERLVALVSRPLAGLLHIALVCLLVTALVIQIAKKVFADRGYSLLLSALVVGAAVTFVLVRSAVAQTLLRYLTPAPLAFLLLFIVASPVGGLVTSSASADTTDTLGGGTRPPIVMIVFDEFPTTSLLNSKGDIDARVYPNFARLQQDSTWFRQGTGVAGSTPFAVPSLVTGRYPKGEVAASHVVYPDNLFTLLGDEYDVHASEMISELCPPRVCGGQAARPDRKTGLRHVLADSARTARQLLSPLKSNDADPLEQFEEADAEHAEPGAATGGDPRARFEESRRANQPDRFTKFLDSLKPAERPTLHFLHVILPHIPFRYLPSGVTYAGAGRAFHDVKPRGTGEMSGSELVYRQRHALQVAYTDGLVGQIIDRLEEQGRYDETMLVMTADHGMGFNGGTAPLKYVRDLHPGNTHEVAYVPTFIKAPGQRAGKVDDRNWESVDLLPTIADAMDITLPFEVDGFSGLGPDRRTTSEKAWFGYDKLRKRSFSGDDARPALMAGFVEQLGRPEHGPAGLFEWGPHKELVGRRPDQLGRGAPASARARVNVKPKVSVDPTRGEVPSMVFGSIAGVPVGTPVAVAVNGRVGGVGLVFEGDGKPDTKIAVMVSDALFRKGGNTFELFLLEPGAANQLRALPFAG